MAYDSAPAKKKAGGASDNDRLATARKRFEYCVAATSENRKLQSEDLKFYAGSPDNGYQWPDKLRNLRENDPNGNRPCLTVNKLPHHVRQVTNEQRLNRPAIKVLPVDDKSDPDVAEIFSGLVRHIENNSDADVAYQTAGEQQTVHGEGYWRILTEYIDDNSFDQDIFVRKITNPFCVYLDPDELKQDATGATCKYGFIVDDLPEDEFKELYPKHQAIDWEYVGSGDNYKHWFFVGEKKVRIAEYFYCEYDDTELLVFDVNGQSIIGFADDDHVKALPAGIQPVKKRKVRRKKVCWEKLTGLECLDKRDWAGKWIPIVRVVGNELNIEGQLDVSGLVRNAKDPQRMVNYWTSQEAEMLALAPKAPFIVAEDQLEGHETEWQQANIKNFAYLKYKPVSENGTLVPPPQRQIPPMPPAGLIQAKAGALEDLKAVTGQYDASLGQAGNEKSGIAIRERKEEGDVSNYHYTDNLARAIRHTGRIVVDLIPKIYDRRRIARILGEDGEPDQIVIDPEQQEAVREVEDNGKVIGKVYNPSVGRYDVTVYVGPSFTTKRQEALEGMTELVQANPDLWKVIGDLLVKNMDWPGAQDMAKRMRKAMPPEIVNDEEEGHPAVAAMQSQLEQAMQIIQELQTGFEAQKMEIEGFSAMTKRFEAESKDKERQFNAAKEYVDRTVADDTELLAPDRQEGVTQ